MLELFSKWKFMKAKSLDATSQLKWTGMTLTGQKPIPKSNKYMFIKTYGCQMNVYDSDRMFELLQPLSYKKTDNPDQADLIILNTCHIREKATEKVFSELGRLKNLNYLP